MDLFGEEPAEEPPVVEPVIASEAVEVLGHPRAMAFCLGHERIEQRLLESFEAGRLPHSLIFSGPKGIGKATLAYKLTKFLLKAGKTDPDQDSLFGDGDQGSADSLGVSSDDPVARLVVSGGHPDLMSVERGYDASTNRYKSGVEVSEIRKIAPFLRMTAADGGWRVVVIDDADTMNRNAQNALLKILEEPPNNTLLILITHRIGALVPTIRSRAQVVSFEPLSSENINTLLSHQGEELSVRDQEILIDLSAGSFGKALQYIEDGGLETLEQILQALETCPDWDWVSLHGLADKFSRAGQDQAFLIFQELFVWIFSELSLAKARGRDMRNSALNQEALQQLLRNSSLEQLLKICENLHEHFERAIAANLDKRQAVLGAFSIVVA